MFKIKNLICFSIIRNEANNNVFTEIIEKLANYEQQKCQMVYDCEKVIKETTTNT